MRLDSTHIVLEKIRVMLNLLRKSNIFNESSQVCRMQFRAVMYLNVLAINYGFRVLEVRHLFLRIANYLCILSQTIKSHTIDNCSSA